MGVGDKGRCGVTKKKREILTTSNVNQGGPGGASPRQGKVIVVGCGRAGTKYMWLVLRSFGLDVGHEEWGADGQVGFHAAVGLRGAAKHRTWRPDLEPSPDDVVLHQVREPLANMSSIQTFQDYSWEFVSRYTPIRMDWPLPVKCMAYWYCWNLMAESHAQYTYQVEHMADAWPDIRRLIGLPPGAQLPEETTTMRHRRGHSKLTWDELKNADKSWYKKVKWLGRHYGYSI
jgi:hypothetical protein